MLTATGGRWLALFLALVLPLMAAPPAAAAAAGRTRQQQQPTDGAQPSFAHQRGPPFAPKRLLVKLKPAAAGVASAAGTAALAQRLPGLELRASLGGGGSGGSARSGGGTARRLLAAAEAVGMGEAVGVFAIRDGSSVAGKAAQLRKLPGVAWASPDRILYSRVLPTNQNGAAAMAATAAAAAAQQAAPQQAGIIGIGAIGHESAAAPDARRRRRLQAGASAAAAAADTLFIPDDANWTSLWHLEAIEAPRAWPLGKGSAAAKICVVDTGMQRGHPDLPQPLDGWNGVPVVDSEGYVLRFPLEGDADFHAWDDGQDHGTHVAGIATAVGNNGVGVTGLAWQAGLLVCRVFNSSDDGAYLSAIMLCMDHCIRARAAVVSMSLGSTGYDDAYADIAQSLKAAGMLWVVPGGNDGATFDATDRTNWEFPAGLAHASYGFDNVIAVAATARDGLIAGYSNRGANVLQLAAPGSYILSTLPLSDGTYGRMSGTSMATPLVAAAAAQLAAAYAARHNGALPSYAELKRVLLATTDPFPDGAQYVVTGGTLNIARAMRLLLFNDAGQPRQQTFEDILLANPARFRSTVERSPGVRLVHFTESASFFNQLSGQTLEQCTNACVSNLRCGKYIFWTPPATTVIDGVAYNCLLWSADADVAWSERNAEVESGLVLRIPIALSSPPLRPRPPRSPPPPPRPRPAPPMRRRQLP